MKTISILVIATSLFSIPCIAENNIFTGNVGIGISDPSAGLTMSDRGNASVRIGSNSNKTNSVVQVVEGINAWARSNELGSEIGAVDVNYYNEGVDTNWSGALVRWYGRNSTMKYWSNKSLAGTAVFLGQNVDNMAIGTNTNAPIYFFNGGGVVATFTPNGNLGIGTETPEGKFVVQSGLSRVSLDGRVVRGAYINHLNGGDLNLQGGWSWSNEDSGTGNGTGNGGRIRLGGGERGDSVRNAILFFNGDDNEAMRISTNGNVGIGTANPSHKLAVKGSIRAQEIIVDTTGWADHVFAGDYQLRPLSEVKQYIQSENRLPGVPSAKEIAQNGISVGQSQTLLLQKIEELTLHIIRQEEEISKLKADMQHMRTQR